MQTASLKGLAKFLGYSLGYTANLVNENFGISLKKLVQEKRLNYSCKLLKETELSISEIICAVGYENESFFRKMFKEKFGLSPLNYRKK